MYKETCAKKKEREKFTEDPFFCDKALNHEIKKKKKTVFADCYKEYTCKV